MSHFKPTSPFPSNAAPRVRQDPMVLWEDRTILVKKEVDAERTASDAKTAKLRALRLAKEAADKETADALENQPKPARRKAAPEIK
jgi:hypothetical protein